MAKIYQMSIKYTNISMPSEMCPDWEFLVRKYSIWQPRSPLTPKCCKISGFTRQASDTAAKWAGMIETRGRHIKKAALNKQNLNVFFSFRLGLHRVEVG
jgi:hypothetical protein